MPLQLRKLSFPLGVEIVGVDISRPLSDENCLEIRKALTDHCLVAIRGQQLDQQQFIAFSRRFGELELDQSWRDPSYPELSRLINVPRTDGSPPDAHYAGSDWHSDNSFKVRPTSISILRCLDLPEVGGDTEFANMYLAYDALSDGMKRLIENLEGVHIQEEKMLDHSSPERLDASRRAWTIANRLVRVHPETRRKALYIGDKVMLFAGMNSAESRPLINYLLHHARRTQFIYRHIWQRHDVVMWDNRCTNHNALGNYDRQNQPRYMEKTAIVGEQYGYVYDDPYKTRNLSVSYSY